MNLEELIAKTCVIGVSYFDTNGELMKQTQFAGQVLKVDAELGITVQLRHTDTSVQQADFIVPPNLDAWFKAPPGHYKHAPSGVDMENPDYLVTWNVYRTQENKPEGQHEWWEWVPNTERPQVGQDAGAG
ncbi:hypothetical protein [Polaromonas sp. A23]|uniref:hypothetical protein n=1 Tax=Polaromonas sp. A23 TaxID=1944133 RepID=UPI000987A86B|nr:hypothetical protein [Polaromonas sp. A23]OOG48260.1 hypothetical protein B0B52_00710 [Polaromonas sp. A23]